MRFCWFFAAAAFAFLLASAAQANVLINVDKRSQQMTVSVNGAPRYHFAVSTGRPGYSTPSGTFHPQRMARTWFSKEYYNSPMPHSIFFHGGFAIHGSYEIDRLGGPASHGCIRLHPNNAATLYALVESEGMAATTVVVSGENSSVRRIGPEQGEYSPSTDYWQRPVPSYQPQSYYQQQQPRFFLFQSRPAPQRGPYGRPYGY
jgi:hypothetical protein